MLVDGDPMPSWNIHIAQTERLLARDGAVASLVRDRNAFLFGNVVPDIFVGYMVPGVMDPIPYRITHFAKQEPIPKPREREFWSTYVAPLAEHISATGEGDVPLVTLSAEREFLNRTHYPARYEGTDAMPEDLLVARGVAAEPDQRAVQRSVLDLVLGAWAHLLADNLWNTRVNEYLDAHGGKPSEEFRIKKQGDFDHFGRLHHLTAVPQGTPRLLAACERFPQYAIPVPYVYASIGVIHETVRTNGGASEHVPYQLLTDEFFNETFDEVLEATEDAISERLG